MLSLGESRTTKRRGVVRVHSGSCSSLSLQLRIYVTFISKLILQQMVLSLIRSRYMQDVIYQRADYTEFF